MDKATLVKSDLEIGGRIIDALSRAKMPVTLFDWNFVPELDEWQLIVATPWYHTRGPRETYSRLIEALQNAGIYQETPIRRIIIKSPDDLLVKNLEREVKSLREGNIHIVDQSTGSQQRYSVVFAPFAGPGGAVPARHFSGREQLRGFLEDDLHIPRSTVDEALADLARKRSASLLGVQLTLRDAKRFGLA